MIQVDSKGLQRWHITLRIIEFLDFVHRPGYRIMKNVQKSSNSH